ncbi:MAG: mannose-1-phosphate guanylyltransferase [Holophagales bacterium]|nr:mannose-1-phosphate guanylyltransferase [Holophagales bacterium]
MIGLILAGGIGSRFWPLSRRRRPKQLLDLLGGGSLVAATARRIEPLCGAERTWVCTTEALAAAVAAELPGLAASRILGEPSGRNTAPAIGWAVRTMPEAARREVIAVMPSDHWVADEDAFREALSRGAAAVERGDHDVVTVGIAPAWPETGYGYLELEAPAEPLSVARGAPGGVEPVLRFTEKPDAETAARFKASGRHFWNAGIFLFRGTVLLDLYREHLPELAAGIERLAADDLGADRRREIYAGLESVSIDYGLMERLDSIGCVVADCGWNDIGSWGLLAEALPADGDGNRTVGDTFAVDARDNLLFADEGAVAVIGVEGLAVVRTGDSVLVVPRERAQDVREVVERLVARGRLDLL